MTQSYSPGTALMFKSYVKHNINKQHTHTHGHGSADVVALRTTMNWQHQGRDSTLWFPLPLPPPCHRRVWCLHHHLTRPNRQKAIFICFRCRKGTGRVGSHWKRSPVHQGESAIQLNERAHPRSSDSPHIVAGLIITLINVRQSRREGGLHLETFVVLN